MSWNSSPTGASLWEFLENQNPQTWERFITRYGSHIDDWLRAVAAPSDFEDARQDLQLSPFCDGSDLRRLASPHSAQGRQAPRLPDDARAAVGQRAGWGFPVRIAVGIAAAALLVAVVAQILVVRNRDGQVVATIPFPPGSSAELASEGAIQEASGGANPDGVVGPPTKALDKGGDVERRVALDTIAAGGYVRLHGQKPDFTRDSQLPGGEFRVHTLSVNSANSISNDQIALWRALSDLKGLDVTATPMSGNQLQHISGISTLRWLYLASTKTSDRDLAHLGKLNQLETLHIADTLVTDEGMTRPLPLPLLSDLILRDIDVGDATLKVFDRFPNLRKLSLTNTRVTDEGLKHLVKHVPELQVLSLEGTSVTDGGLVHLKQLASLTQLDLRVTRTTDEGVAAIRSAMPNCVVQEGNPEGDAAVATLQAGGTVKIWGIDGNIGSVRDLPDRSFKIDKIALRESQKLDDTTAELIGRLESLRALYLDRSSLSDNGFASITKVKSLRWIYLPETQVTAEGIARCGNLDSLISMKLSNLPVTDENLQGFALPALQNLWLKNAAVTDDGIPHLRNFPALRLLNLSIPGLTDRGIESLVKAAPNLEELTLKGTKISDKGLGHLRQLTRLKMLDVSGANLTPAAITELLEEIAK